MSTAPARKPLGTAQPAKTPVTPPPTCARDRGRTPRNRKTRQSPLIFFLLIQRNLVSGMSAGAVKG